MSYRIRYTVLDSNLIYNYAGPGYGKHSCSKEAREVAVKKHVDCRNNRDNFFNDLEKSVLRDGFRNPIIVQAGFMPPSVWKVLPDYLKVGGIEQFLICMDWGGSRLYVAQKYKLPVPCVILDFVNRFADEQLLSTVEQIRSVFVDKPTSIVLMKDRLDMKTDIHQWKNQK